MGPETGRCTHPLPAKDALDRIPVFLGDGRGWRHLRLMLVYSPGFLFLIPGAAMVFLGLLTIVTES